MASARAYVREYVRICTRTRRRWEGGAGGRWGNGGEWGAGGGSMVPAVLLFGTARRVNPGQCVAKKPYIRRACRSGKKRERRREREGGRRRRERQEGRKGRRRGAAGAGREGGRRKCARPRIARTRMRARAPTCSRTQIGECVRDATSTPSIAVMPVCQTGPRPASELRARRALSARSFRRDGAGELRMQLSD